MAEYLVMPKLGFDMREAELVTWLKEVGDPVEKGEVIAEIESDKATLELEAQSAGTLLKKLETENAIVPVGGNIAIIGEEGEDISGMDAGAAEAETEPADAEVEETHAEPVGAAKTDVTPEDEEAGAAVSDEYPGGVKATPVARRMAAEHDVDLAQLEGSGPGGRIRKADVERYLEEGPAPAAAEPAKPTPSVEPTTVQAGPGAVEVETSKMRQAIGRRMVESKTTVPHFYVTTAVNMDAAFALRKEVNQMLPEEEKVSINDMIVKATALALREFPNLNASFAGDKIVRHRQINVGTAVAVENGLTTVVQQNTAGSTLSTIAADNKAMIARAREGKIKPEDVQGGTFTVSNLGAYEVDSFVAIINPPQAAILAVGRAQKTPVVKEGEIVIGTQMKATISADHRVTDGAEAAAYMDTFKQILEEPMRLLI